MKIATLNAENLFLVDGLGHSIKSEDKTQSLAKNIKMINPDILLLQEVGGQESLDIFNEQYLDHQYITGLIPGNSDRNIQLAFLIKKTFSLQFSLYTNKHRPLDLKFPEEKLSRDILELRIANSHGLKLIILNVHLKSKWDRQGNDPDGSIKRKKEAKLLANLYLTLKDKFKCPIIIAGDFNSLARNSDHIDEFLDFHKKTNLTDLLELINAPDRDTFYYFDRSGNSQHAQFDYIFLPPELQKYVKKATSGVFYYKNEDLTELKIPSNHFERLAFPSDHLPIVLELENFPE